MKIRHKQIMDEQLSEKPEGGLNTKNHFDLIVRTWVVRQEKSLKKDKI
jgi:hypothetical protein